MVEIAAPFIPNFGIKIMLSIKLSNDKNNKLKSINLDFPIDSKRFCGIETESVAMKKPNDKITSAFLAITYSLPNKIPITSPGNKSIIKKMGIFKINIHFPIC